MKQLVIILFSTLFVACKKEPAKYCPVMQLGQSHAHLVDLAPVSHIPQIMDTIGKYPQLQVYRVYFQYGHDPGSVYAGVFCNIYYKDLIIFDKGYNLIWDNESSYSGPVHLYPIPKELSISTEPSISVEKATAIAEKTMHYTHCEVSQLGLWNFGTDSIPQYKLVWRIMGAEGGYPIVNLDAQNGEVYSTSDGIFYD